MTPRPLKIDHALKALPEVDDLVHLREALIGASRDDGERAWSASAAYATLDTRLADPAALEAQVAALADRVRQRVEAVLRHSLHALRGLEGGDPAAAARALVAAGEVEEEAGRLDAAEGFYRQALALGRRPRDRSGEGLALRRLGRVARERGHLDEALRLYLAGYEVAAAQRDTEGAVVACQGVGNVYGDQGLWEQAREWYARGVELLGEAAPARALWQLYSNLSVVARRTGDLDASAAWLDRAGAVVQALGDAAGVLPIENGRARLLVERGELAAAEAAYRRSLEGQGSPSLRGAVLSNLAECLLLEGKLREAEEAARELERLAVVHRLTPLLPHAYRGLGAVARARGDAEGFVFYEQALDLCRAPGTPPIELAATQHEYALLDAGAGRRESAAARLEEALAIYRRLGTRPEIERAERDLAALGASASAATPDGPTEG
ncbi:MAG TPA: tetratricopeptide repeat protein [Longimicrobium sp.]|jgi:tetratricopeptide (TPR) repeat protein